MRKTGIGRDREREGGKEMLRGSEKGGESLSPAMTAKRREYLDLCSLPKPLCASSPGSIKPQSRFTITSLKFSSKSL